MNDTHGNIAYKYQKILVVPNPYSNPESALKNAENPSSPPNTTSKAIQNANVIAQCINTTNPNQTDINAAENAINQLHQGTSEDAQNGE